MSKKYRITLTREQLLLISNCVEDCHRFMSGQVEMSHCTSYLDNMHDTQDILKNAYPFVVPQLWKEHRNTGASYGWNGGGCPNEHQRKFIAQTYYLYREILHALLKDSEDWNVYHSETLTCKDSGEPIEIEEI